MTTVSVAQGARSQLLFHKQSALGVPYASNYQTAKLVSHTINPNVETVVSQSIRADRHLSDQRMGNRSVRGSSVHELTYIAHDSFLEGAMFSTFSVATTDDAGIISGVGVTPSYFSMEDGALDISTYRPFYDMVVSHARLDFGTGRNAIARATFDWVGLSGGDPASASIGGTAIAPPNRVPFDTFDAALYDNQPGTGTEMIEVTSLQIDINNNANPIFGVGQQTAIAVEYGRGLITGSLSMYYTQRARQTLDRFLREINGYLVWTITDPDNNTMEFRLPNVKFTGGDVPLANEQSRIITVPFAAMYSSSPGFELKITKTGI
jgi:hypothetical protein